MPSTIRVSDETHRRIGHLARRCNKQMQTIVEEAIAAYERDRFWDEFDAGWDDADDAGREADPWDRATRDGLR